MELQSFHNFKKNSFSNCPRSWSNDQLPGLSLCPKGSQKSVTTGIIEAQTKDLSIEPWKQNMQSSGSYPLYVERQVFCRHDSFWTSDLQRYETGLLVRSDRNEAYAGQWYFRLVAAMRAARWVPRGGKTAYEHLTEMRVGGFLFSAGCRGQIKYWKDLRSNTI